MILLGVTLFLFQNLYNWLFSGVINLSNVAYHFHLITKNFILSLNHIYLNVSQIGQSVDKLDMSVYQKVHIWVNYNYLPTSSRSIFWKFLRGLLSVLKPISVEFRPKCILKIFFRPGPFCSWTVLFLNIFKKVPNLKKI